MSGLSGEEEKDEEGEDDDHEDGGSLERFVVKDDNTDNGSASMHRRMLLKSMNLSDIDLPTTNQDPEAYVYITKSLCFSRQWC